MTDATYLTQLPAEVNLEITDDNDLIFTVDWHMDISLYTFAANIIPAESEDEIAMTVTIVSAPVGTMTIKITRSSILDISPSTNRWYLNWTDSNGYVRTVLAGALVLRSK
jgi:hypothetical protein